MKSKNNTNLILFHHHHHHHSLTTKPPPLSAANHHHHHHRLLYIFFISFFTLIFTFSLLSSSSTTSSHSLSSPSSSSLSPPLLAALLHYTSTSQPNKSMSFSEISAVSSVIASHSSSSTCNLLVFGITHESLLWRSINFKGRTVFIDDNPYSVSRFEQSNLGSEAYDVVYTTKVSQASKLLSYYRTRHECRPVQNLLFSDCELGINDLPNFVYEIDWDVILIDGPRGYALDSPGRMAPIYTTAVLARSKKTTEKKKKKTDVFVHEFGREIERDYSEEFLCRENLVEVVGDLARFSVFAAEEEEEINGFCRNSTKLSERFAAVSGGGDENVGGE